MAESIKQRLLAKDVIVVCNTDFPTAQMVEFVGKLGFDALFIDCEHSSTDFSQVEELARAARGAGLASVLRPWTNEPGLINRYLSCGVGGIQAPHVHNARDAARLVQGVRDWSQGDPAEKIVVVMVESIEAVEDLPALLAMPELDVFYFGQNDLASSMGLRGGRKDPKVRAIVEDAIKRVADAGKVAGMNVQDEIDATQHFMRLGLRWINVHMKQFMAAGSKAFLTDIRGKAPVAR